MDEREEYFIQHITETEQAMQSNRRVLQEVMRSEKASATAKALAVRVDHEILRDVIKLRYEGSTFVRSLKDNMHSQTIPSKLVSNVVIQ